mgnify:FL=1|jgi:hypothetical protein
MEETVDVKIARNVYKCTPDHRKKRCKDDNIPEYSGQGTCD